VSSISTHILDVVRGAPAVGVTVQLTDHSGNVIATATTDSNGRIPQLAEVPLGIYRLVFETGKYYPDTFYPEIVVTFGVSEHRHYHVPLTLSPFSYSTYLGT